MLLRTLSGILARRAKGGDREKNEKLVVVVSLTRLETHLTAAVHRSQLKPRGPETDSLIAANHRS